MSRQGRTSEEWWNTTKSNEEKLLTWLKKQYHGETKAAQRIALFRDTYQDTMKPSQYKVISIISEQEQDHASWVAELLIERGVIPEVINDKEEPYWEQTLPGIDSFIQGAAIAAHAEEMRLERIRVIANDESCPSDIREVFSKILPQEEFHARAFKKMSTQEAYEETQHAHELGRVALGLVV